VKEDLDIHFFVYSIPFWIKSIVDDTLSIACLRSPSVQIFIDTLTAMIMPPLNLFSSLQPYVTLLQAFTMSLKENCIAKHNIVRNVTKILPSSTLNNNILNYITEIHEYINISDQRSQQ
jgi:hypothetical protein